MKRKPLAKDKPVKVRQRRARAVPFDRCAALPVAIVDGLFLAPPTTRIYAWRTRSGERPKWHTCKVVRTAPEYVELWDETLGQWFCFNPKAPDVPDIRMEYQLVAKTTAEGVLSV